MIDKGFEEFGAKVRRAQDEVERLRGRALREGVRIEVDAGNRLTAIELDPQIMQADAGQLAELIQGAYTAAVTDLQPRLRQALSEVTGDPRVAGFNRWIGSQNTDADVDVHVDVDVDVDEPTYLDLRGGTVFER